MVAAATFLKLAGQIIERRAPALHIDYLARGQLTACARVEAKVRSAFVRDKHSAQDRRRPWMDLGTSDKRLNDWRRGAAAELAPFSRPNALKSVTP